MLNVGDVNDLGDPNCLLSIIHLFDDFDDGNDDDNVTMGDHNVTM